MPFYPHPPTLLITLGPYQCVLYKYAQLFAHYSGVQVHVFNQQETACLYRNYLLNWLSWQQEPELIVLLILYQCFIELQSFQCIIYPLELLQLNLPIQEVFWTSSTTVVSFMNFSFGSVEDIQWPLVGSIQRCLYPAHFNIQCVVRM